MYAYIKRSMCVGVWVWVGGRFARELLCVCTPVRLSFSVSLYASSLSLSLSLFLFLSFSLSFFFSFFLSLFVSLLGSQSWDENSSRTRKHHSAFLTCHSVHPKGLYIYMCVCVCMRAVLTLSLTLSTSSVDWRNRFQSPKSKSKLFYCRAHIADISLA